jgi:hypothetical protein
MMRAYPVNPAEAVIAPFFDPALSPEKEWRLMPGPTTQNLHAGRGYTTMLYWDGAEADQTVFTWEWHGRLDLPRYDGLFLQATFPAWTTMVFSAQVDGVWQRIAASRGSNRHDDYSGPLAGHVVEGLRIELVTHTASAGAFGTYYIGAHHQQRLADWLAYENPDAYSPNWSEYLRPDSEWKLEPQIGLYFDAGQLDALRQKLSRSPYREMADILRQQAYECLTWEPERGIRPYLACGESPWSYSARSRDRGRAWWGPMEQCAFFGLLDGDPQLIRMAARFALSLAHVRHWSEGFVENDFPGSAVNWRSFYQNMVCISLAATLDWIGGVFTENAQEVLCHSLYFKGLAPIKQDLLRCEYLYHMNQGTVFSLGRAAALLAINGAWPRAGWEIEQTHRDLDETANNIIHADGGYGEGPAYYSYTMTHLLAAYLLLAKHKGAAPEHLMPPGVLRGADYFGLYVSTSDQPARLPLSDGPGDAIPTDWLAMFAHVTGDPRWKGLLHRGLTHGLTANIDSAWNRIWVGSGVRTLIYGPDDLDDRADIVPVFGIHAGSGHATSRRVTERGPVRLHLCGASLTEEHSHEDKGAILLEVLGEPILIDRGITVYSDPITSLLKPARMHNTVTPLDSAGHERAQARPCPSPIIPSGYGDDTRLHLEIDVTPAWGEAVKRAARRIDSEDVWRFTVTDELECAEPMPVIFHLHSHAPVVVSGQRALFDAERSRLRVTWEWAGEVICAGEDLCDGEHRPVQHLAVRSVSATGHRLITHFEIIPKAPA